MNSEASDFTLIHFASQAQCSLLVRLFPGERWAEVMWQTAFTDGALQQLRARQMNRKLDN